MINYKIEKLFPPNIILIGYLLILCALIILLGKKLILLGGILILVGLFLCSTTRGILINQKTNEYKEYINIFGFKIGKWNSYKNYPNIGILSKKLNFSMYSLGQVKTSLSDRFYEINFMSENHRSRILIKRFKSEDLAQEEAKKLEKLLNVKLVTYSPR